MRIWILNHYAVPAGGKHGARHAILAKYLKDMGHEVTIFAASLVHGTNAPSHTTEFTHEGDYVDEFLDGVRWRFIRTKPYRSNFHRFRLMRDFEARVLSNYENLPTPDVVIGSCVHPFAVEAARKIARRLNVPFIYEIRDIWPESLVDVGGMSRWHPAYLIFRHLEIKALRDASGVIALLPGIQDYLENHGVVASRVCYLPNGIDPDDFPQVSGGTKKGRFVFSYFGAHGPANGLDNILNAAKYLQDMQQSHIHIQIVGDGASKPALLNHARQIGIKNISFFDSMPKSKLKDVAQESDGYVFNLKTMPIIKKYGLSSNKLFEYLAYGRPVVFSCASFNDPVSEADAGLSVPPENPQAMAEALLKISKLPTSRLQEMGENGRAYAFENHDLAKISKRLEAFVENQISLFKQAKQGLAA